MALPQRETVRKHRVVTPCFVRGIHWPEGKVVDLDDNKPEDLNLIVELYGAGRLLTVGSDADEAYLSDKKSREEASTGKKASTTNK